MCEQDRRNGEILVGEKTTYLVGLWWCVDHYRLATVLVGKHPGVGLRHPGRDLTDQHSAGRWVVGQPEGAEDTVDGPQIPEQTRQLASVGELDLVLEDRDPILADIG